MKGLQTIYDANTHPRIVEVTIVILKYVDFRASYIIRDKEEHGIIMRTTQQDIIVTYVCALKRNLQNI